MLDKLFKRFFVGERTLLIEAHIGVGKTRIALEFVREVWRRGGRCRVMVVVLRRFSKPGWGFPASYLASSPRK
jgi:hypothetical protein